MMFLAAKWMGVDLDEEHLLIAYPESFDIRGLIDEFAVAEKSVAGSTGFCASISDGNAH
ncbi:hypothetical protein QM083_26800 [Klebsiella pneumoniae]|nr:hypothetical protein [Klebsiella pneumoniae]